MKGLKKTLVIICPYSMRTRALTSTFFSQLSRKSSQDSNSKNKNSGANSNSNSSTGSGSTINSTNASGSGATLNSNASTAPPPPPNATKPPQQVASSNHTGYSNSNSSNHTHPIHTTSSRSNQSNAHPSHIPDRRYPVDAGPSGPPILVVSPDGSPSESSHRPGFHGSDRNSLTPDHGTPPRATTLNRLRSGPRDTIPVVGKPPRKQRSSRFVVTEKVDIFQLPSFMGQSPSPFICGI
jgi:serine/threonine-protein phosphatase 2A regulatory subunit B'